MLFATKFAESTVEINNISSAVNISLGDNTINSNLIGCINVSSKNTKTKSDKKRVEKIEKLRQLGLSDQEIVEILELPLEVVQEVEV